MVRLHRKRVLKSSKGCRRRDSRSTQRSTKRARKQFSHARFAQDPPVDDRHEDTRLLRANLSPSRERWIGLGLFCALACSQSCVWNSWGPIAGSAIVAFPSWRKSHVALLSNWGCIDYLVFALPCCWFLHREGLRTPLRTAAVLSALATFLRCISSQETIFTIATHAAAIVNGLSGVIIGPATALLSATWFPPGERTTATGISSAFNQLGMAVSYLIGPALVEVPTLNDTDRSQTAAGNDLGKDRVWRRHFARSMKSDSANVSAMKMILRVQIVSLMRIEFVMQSLVLVGVLLFFPRQDPHGVLMPFTQFGLKESVLSLLRNKSMWQLCMATALSQGVTGPWLAMITMSFGSTITQNEADKLAFWTIVFGSVLSLVASRLMDAFQGRLKVAIYVLLTISSAMFLWVLLLVNRVLVFHKGELYTAVILGISTSWSTPALFLELASEIAFPVSEAIVGGYMIFLANLVGALFYFSYFLPGMGEYWSSYLVFGNVTVAAILVIYVKDEYNRTKIESSAEYKMHRTKQAQKN